MLLQDIQEEIGSVRAHPCPWGEVGEAEGGSCCHQTKEDFPQQNYLRSAYPLWPKGVYLFTLNGRDMQILLHAFFISMDIYKSSLGHAYFFTNLA